MAHRFLKGLVLVALLSPLGGCVQGMPDAAGWLSTYPHMCLPGFHAVVSAKGDGYRCDPNSSNQY